jgi:hypothetical protein
MLVRTETSAKILSTIFAQENNIRLWHHLLSPQENFQLQALAHDDVSKIVSTLSWKVPHLVLQLFGSAKIFDKSSVLLA